jgi:hypothetical protein
LSVPQADFSYDEFEELLLDYLATTDQPFDQVESPAFRNLLQYLYHRKTPLLIPSRKVVKRKLMKRGEDRIEELKAMIAVRFIL